MRPVTSIRILLGIAAFAISMLVGAISFVVLALALPVWGLALFYGRDTLLHSPGHGGALAMAVWLFTVPLAAVAAITFVGLLTAALYKRLASSKWAQSGGSGV